MDFAFQRLVGLDSDFAISPMLDLMDERTDGLEFPFVFLAHVRDVGWISVAILWNIKVYLLVYIFL